MVLFGVMSGITVAVTLALLRFPVQMARPSDQLFGIIPGTKDSMNWRTTRKRRPCPAC